MAEWLSRSPAGSAREWSLPITPHRSVVSITCTLVASSSGTAQSAGAQDPHRGCADLGGIRKEGEGLLWENSCTGLRLWVLQGSVLPCWYNKTSGIHAGTHFNSWHVFPQHLLTYETWRSMTSPNSLILSPDTNVTLGKLPLCSVDLSSSAVM